MSATETVQTTAPAQSAEASAALRPRHFRAVGIAMRDAARTITLITAAALGLAGFVDGKGQIVEAGKIAARESGVRSVLNNQGRLRASYDSIAIATPKENETVFDNSGNVKVSISLLPELRGAAGDRIVVLVDGIAAVKAGTSELHLSGLVRGRHTLEARVVNDNGETVISSAPVTFYVWQASRLFRNRG